MGDTVKVGGSGIDTLISDMKGGVDKLTNRLSEMDRDLRPHMAEWEGGAQGAYETAQRRWKTEISDLKELLEDVRKAVQESKEDYLAGELKNEQSWDS